MIIWGRTPLASLAAVGGIMCLVSTLNVAKQVRSQPQLSSYENGYPEGQLPTHFPPSSG